MAEERKRLSARAVTVLEMIAAGTTYEQILSSFPDFTYLDIFAAAEEALDLNDHTEGPAYRLAEVRSHHPRAYEKWTDAEDATIRQLVDAGVMVADMATQLGRQRTAIRSRIEKLGLFERLSPAEQGRYPRPRTT